MKKIVYVNLLLIVPLLFLIGILEKKTPRFIHFVAIILACIFSLYFGILVYDDLTGQNVLAKYPKLRKFLYS